MSALIILIAALLLIIIFSAVLKVHPVPVLLGSGFFYGAATGMSPEDAVKGLTHGFGATMGSVGFIIIAGTIIGVFMEKRGAVQLLAEKMVRLTGRKNLPMSLAGTGFIASIAIFCDSAFVILTGLCQKGCQKAGIPIAVGTGALAMGLFSAHCLFPPTPGPVAAVGLIGADMGLTILLGVIAAIAATISGWLVSLWLGKNVRIPADEEGKNLREKDEKAQIFASLAHSEEASAETAYRGSSLWASLPMIVPLFLILIASIYKFAVSEEWQTAHETLTRVTLFLGLPIISLTLGALLAIFTLGRVKKDELSVGGEMGKAILQAANILVITSAGGAFGELLRQSSTENSWITQISGNSPWMILLPAVVAAFIKTAQGSSTVAIITTSGIFAPILANLGLDTESLKALTVVSIGAGALVVSHTNDSYFWIVTQFSGFSVRQGLKIVTLGSLVCGIVAALAVLAMSFILRFPVLGG